MKRAKAEPLKASRLRELLHYDPDTGIFAWRVGRQGTPQGSIAGNRRRDGRVLIGIDQVRYMAHRLAWLYVTGQFPDTDLDHKDCDPSNNRFDNLRPATFSQNQRNQPTPRNNTSGFKGVTFHKQRGRWRAQIKHKGKVKHLGLFDTPQEAHQAYCKAATEIDPQFARFA
jgi:hypothetical protein